MEKLSLVLWQERELLDDLLFRLEVEQLVLASGRTNHLMRAARDVEATLQQLRETEVLRAVAADLAAEQLGLAPNPALSELAAASPEPWSTVLADHREAFESTTRRIMELADANRDLITSGYRSARETLMALGDPAPHAYSPDGSAVAAPTASRLLDRSI
ncbi:flagellar protein FlgN [Nocardioides sp. R-C-SC26]|uniref:flagellar protein FlgN n=1 Tax=Nocardioides sp. R-C-SC26 TaxID=2870414 RepID=UPI001E56011A|nr:flagellar protein FlgN [Nocardioides sp. R-C-SC26]